MRVEKVSFRLDNCKNCMNPEKVNREYIYMPTTKKASNNNGYFALIPLATVIALSITLINILHKK